MIATMRACLVLTMLMLLMDAVDANIKYTGPTKQDCIDDHKRCLTNRYETELSCGYKQFNCFKLHCWKKYSFDRNNKTRPRKILALRFACMAE
ncbi:hypothetical protein ScPMuIL_005263 [Solemya velum]